jgi:hypothetical protein
MGCLRWGEGIDQFAISKCQRVGRRWKIPAMDAAIVSVIDAPPIVAEPGDYADDLSISHDAD